MHRSAGPNWRIQVNSSGYCSTTIHSTGPKIAPFQPGHMGDRNSPLVARAVPCTHCTYSTAARVRTCSRASRARGRPCTRTRHTQCGPSPLVVRSVQGADVANHQDSPNFSSSSGGGGSSIESIIAVPSHHARHYEYMYYTDSSA